MATKRTSPSVAGILGLVGIGVLPLLCCAGPALIAGGALGALGGVLGNPWLIGATAVLVIAAVGYALRRHRRQDCHTASTDRKSYIMTAVVATSADAPVRCPRILSQTGGNGDTLKDTDGSRPGPQAALVGPEKTVPPERVRTCR